MPEQNTPAPFKPSSMIEFEFTDITAARQAAGRPEAVVAIEKLMPGFWEDHRRPLTATDRALSGKGIDWMLSLPVEVRPKALCEHFPRIANHLAERWADLPNTRLALMRLLADERGGRKGFSLQVEQEIGRLAAHVQSQLDLAPTVPAAR